MKLEGQANYMIWSYKVKMFLMQEDLWRYISPATNSTSSSSSSSADSGIAANTEAGDTGGEQGSGSAVPVANGDMERKIKACRIIIATVKDSLLLHVIHLTDPLAIWNKLRTMYDVQSPSRRLALKEKLYSLRMGEGKTIDSHLQEVNSIVTQLAGLGVMISDEDLVDQVLASLPKSWSTFKAIQKGRERLPTFAELEGMLLHEESSRIIDQQQEEAEEVLYANNRVWS